MSLPVAAAPAAPEAATPPSLVIGIDFGTHASGFAFRKTAVTTGTSASASSLRVSTHDRWPDQPTPDAKTRTALLYRGNRVEAWGWSAWKRWSELSASERRQQSYTYLENFKLLLEEGAAEGVDTVCPLPRGVTRVQAVADYLAEMKKYIKDHLRRTAGINLTTDDVIWCLTLPAIWSDAAKARMREAAHRAGLTVRVDSRSLQLTLEPEAAALSAVLTGEAAPGAALQRVGGGGAAAAAAASLSDGDVLLVLDCGGGTADATLHRVRGSGSAARLEEAAVGRGALAGGAHVDSAAWRYMRELLGAQQWDAWGEAHPEELVKLKTKWELSKRSYMGSQGPPAAPPSATRLGDGDLFSGLVKVAGVQRGDIRLPLPEGLINQIGQQALRALSSPSASGGWVGADRALVLPAGMVAQQLFDPAVDRAVELMRGIAGDGIRLGHRCNKVLLAGGFARSPYLQSRVRRALPAGADLLIPADPGAAVVTGAVLYGAVPYMVSSRRCRVGYGVGTNHVWGSADALHAAQHGYPKKFWHSERACYYASDVYRPFVEPGQLVRSDEVFKHSFYPMYRNQTAVSFELYSTSVASRRYLRNGETQYLAEVTLKLPWGWVNSVSGNHYRYSLEAEMRFGATELTLVASDPRTKDAVATVISWSADMA